MSTLFILVDTCPYLLFAVEHESAPIHNHGLLGLQIEHKLHGIGRVDVHILHEIARQLGANGQGQKINCANALANADEVSAVASVSWD